MAHIKVTIEIINKGAAPAIHLIIHLHINVTIMINESMNVDGVFPIEMVPPHYPPHPSCAVGIDLGFVMGEVAVVGVVGSG